MGGPGSGSHYHWWRSGKKTAVEDCRQIDAGGWTRGGVLNAGGRLWGRCAWTDGRTGEETASLGFEVAATGPTAGRLWLSYAVGPGGESLRYAVALETTRLRGGGLRWWFTCPLSPGGVPCGRRVGKLYLPPGGRYFGCRRCHGLTYRSCQESHKDRAFFRLMAGPGEDPDELSRTFNRLCRLNRP